jgi:hypothetical protein
LLQLLRQVQQGGRVSLQDAGALTAILVQVELHGHSWFNLLPEAPAGQLRGSGEEHKNFLTSLNTDICDYLTQTKSKMEQTWN